MEWYIHACISCSFLIFLQQLDGIVLKKHNHLSRVKAAPSPSYSTRRSTKRHDFIITPPTRLFRRNMMFWCNTESYGFSSLCAILKQYLSNIIIWVHLRAERFRQSCNSFTSQNNKSFCGVIDMPFLRLYLSNFILWRRHIKVRFCLAFQILITNVGTEAKLVL